MTPLTTAPTVLIRASRGSELLVAETDGALVAAHAPATGATIADPFRRTAELVELLELRGSLLRAA